MTASRVIRFDGWTLDCCTGELQRAGVRVRLQSQPLAVLESLLAQPGEMVSREELIARLWPRGVVDFDTALNSAVRRLRTALQDHADHPQYIETIPKRGYRFIGRLDEDVRPAGSTESAARRSAPVAARATAAADAPIAAHEIAAADRPIAVIAARPRIGMPRVALALVAASLLTGLLAWPAWRPQVPALPAELVAAPTTAVVPAEAEDVYRQGRFLLQRRGPGDVQSARERFEATVALYPSHARAWAGIASTWWLDVVEQRTAPAGGLAAVHRAATRALELDPHVAEAHLRLANVAWYTGERVAGDAHLREAVALEPDDPLVSSFAASAAAERGDWATAVAMQRRAVDADPLGGAVRHNLAVFLYLAGRYDEAAAQLQELRTLNPTDADAAALLGVVRVLAGDLAEALRVADQLGDAASAAQVRALAYHALGRQDESDRALEALEQHAGGPRAYLVAEVHAYRGEADAAFEWLEIAADAGPGQCAAPRCTSLEWLPSSPLLRTLASDARWQRWLAHVHSVAAA
ncbi:MAG TPA: winged helix-turn-helix domain-containing protein [Steroidobacteraceae bacterium]|nr:winged helix-turn-helix domain-containing protein [Steroidobacteraceae bacterium]